MLFFEMIWQVNQWLMLLAGCVALCVVLTWPAVKGKWWLVVSLSLILLSEVYTCLFPYLINQSDLDEAGRVMMGPVEYQNLWMVQMIIFSLSLVGKLIFVVAVYQLRSQLRRILEHF